MRDLGTLILWCRSPTPARRAELTDQLHDQLAAVQLELPIDANFHGVEATWDSLYSQIRNLAQLVLGTRPRSCAQG